MDLKRSMCFYTEHAGIIICDVTPTEVEWRTMDRPERIKTPRTPFEERLKEQGWKLHPVPHSPDYKATICGVLTSA